MKVAIIDDNEVFRKLTKLSIQRLTLNVSEILLFENGKEAIDFIKESLSVKENIPKIILLDLNMPVMDGWKFLEEMLPINKDYDLKTIIYIVTSSAEDDDIERAKHISDVKGYLIKPIRSDQIIELVNEFS
ncbi:response regulator [Zhouia sp. PK063]|uniref:response regulator n=1 Tax=Zhouia sp. PK063 TaxID=3373602 RepID=UPI003797C0FE